MSEFLDPVFAKTVSINSGTAVSEAVRHEQEISNAGR